MAVKIRLKRLGKIRAPYYRIVVVDARAKRDGRVIEEVGKYHPTEEPSYISVNSERVQYWLSVGAQPTEAVLAQLKLTGDWQKFKGLPYEEGTLKVAAAHAAEDAKQALESAEAEALKAVTAQAEAKAKAAKEAEAAAAKEEAAQAKAEAEAAKAAAAEAKEPAAAEEPAASAKPETTPEAKVPAEAPVEAPAKTEEPAKADDEPDKADEPAKAEESAEATTKEAAE